MSESQEALQEQGYARIARAVLAFANRFGFEVLGAERLVMVADPAYFAIDLYRSMGFVDRETQLQIERPVLG